MKTLLYRHAPKVFARVRYGLAQPLAGTREEFESLGMIGRWLPMRNNIQMREYGSYEQYVWHQAAKYDYPFVRDMVLSSNWIASDRRRFLTRFLAVARTLKRKARILCTGARSGTEVEVWRDLGFRDAIGVDLNPGLGNSLVIEGDFHALQFENGRFDVVYSNAVDHAHDLDLCFAEAARVLAPGGTAMFDLSDDPPNRDVTGHLPGDIESVGWRRSEDVTPIVLRHFSELLKAERRQEWIATQYCVTVRKQKKQ